MDNPQMKVGEASSFLRKQIKTRYPGLRFSAKIVNRDYGEIHITWFDGPTFQGLTHEFRKYRRVDYKPIIITCEDGVERAAYIHLCYGRYYSLAFFRRVATLYCRKHQYMLPEIIFTTAGAECKTDTPLAREISSFIKGIDESTLEGMEREYDECYLPLPKLTEEEVTQREQQKQCDTQNTIRDMEIERLRLDYEERLYNALVQVDSTYTEKITDLLLKKEKLNWRVRQHAPLEIENPVICASCFQYIEYETCEHVDTMSVYYDVCQTCQNNHARLFPIDPPIPVEEEVAPTIFTKNDEGIYIGNNGEHVPLLTRDLLLDCRLSKWWLRFEKKPCEAVRKALHDAGWGWGPGRVQWHNGNQFGLLKIPPIIFMEYGGYVDGGYCDYRSTRGDRLRAYAEKVAQKANELEEWSNAIVAKYMSTGVIVTGGPRTRKLQKEKDRAEKKAAMARWLDQYAEELYSRANRSERYQSLLASTPMLHSRIVTLRTQARREYKHFHEAVSLACNDYTSLYRLRYPETHILTVAHFLKQYDEMEQRIDLIEDEIELLEMTIYARETGQRYEPLPPEPQKICIPTRTFNIDEVTEVPVGDNRLDLYPTPREVSQLFKHAIPRDAQRILEGHGGTASLLKELMKWLTEWGMSETVVETCELSWQLNQALRSQGYTVVGDDFLEYHPEIPYCCVVINPPFTRWWEHSLHALELTKKGGRSIQTLPDGSLERERGNAGIRTFQQALQSCTVERIPVPAGAFQVSNTNTATEILIIDK